MTTEAAPVVDLEAIADASTAASANPQSLASITELGREMFRLELEIERDQAALAAKAKRLTEIQMELLPDRMLQVGMSSFALDNGYAIQVKDFVSASIPSQTSIDKASGVEKDALIARRDKAHQWLRRNRAAELIKNRLTAEFGKGQDKAAKNFLALMIKGGYVARCDESVNFQTLNAFLKSKLAEGVDVPSEPFALYVGKRAEIKAPKKAK